MSEWPYNDRPAGVRFLPDRLPEPGRTEIEDELWSWIVRGRDDAAEFVDYLEDDEGRHGATDEELAAGYERALEVRRNQQREWGPVVTNLTRAFDELTALGIVARQNFTCCGSCATAEIDDERDDSRHWRGYIWYHQQDTDALIASPAGAVYLGYGAWAPEDFDEAAYEALPDAEQRAEYEALVRRLLDDVVFPVLRKHGMQVNWNWSQSTRILLTGARWYAPMT